VKITRLRIRNYRTLEDVSLDFPASYAAICGPNDSGKTNVVRAIRAIMKEESPFPFVSFPNDEELSFKDDFPKWKDTPLTERQIAFEVALRVDSRRDAGLYQFLTKQLSLDDPASPVDVNLTVTHTAERPEPDVTVSCAGRDYTGLEAEEVLKRLQSSRSILFHNSTQIDPYFPFRSQFGGIVRTESPEHQQLVASMKKTVNRGLKKIARRHQKEIEDLLGKLETKYRVGLSMPAFDFTSIPFSVTLGQKRFEVPLEDWGSGTKNRTLILMTLFRAKQLGDAKASAGKLIPVIVVEEPESFLHPAAQAEFGHVLQDLAEEFDVQVIVTTHSPYMLNMERPEANILLERRTRYRQLQETRRVDVSGDNWMEPFGLALGLESEELRPWKNLLLSGAEAVLLVEGETDKAYFEMLRDAGHGNNRLDFSGEVVSYDGTGSLRNTVLLRFIKNRYRRLFVTYDLDAHDSVVPSLTALGLERNKQFAPVGLNAPGKRSIEGLLPEAVTSAVYAANAELVQVATQGSKKEQQAARGELKKLLLAEFKQKASPGAEYYGHFYPLVRKINKALGRKGA